MWKNEALPEFGVLSGLKVVHASSSLAGPLSPTIFAEYGADVVWVENADAYDYTRTLHNIQPESERRNQRAVALRLRSEEGRQILLDLLKDADIFIESSKGGQFDHLNLSDETLWEVNPKLVIAHISGYGQTGLPEYVNRGGFDTTAQAFSGYMWENTNGGATPPYAVGPYVADYMTALWCGLACLAAVRKADQTGEGESLDIAQYELMMRASIFSVDYFTFHKEFPKTGEKSMIAGWGGFPCKDGKYLYCCFTGAGVLEKCCKLLGLEYGSDLFPAGASLYNVTTESGIAFEKAVAEWLQERTVDEAEQEMLAAGLPVSKINSWEDVENNPHVQARGVIEEWETVKGTKLRAVGPLPKFKKHPARVWRPAPSFGENNEEILHISTQNAYEILDEKMDLYRRWISQVPYATSGGIFSDGHLSYGMVVEDASIASADEDIFLRTTPIPAQQCVTTFFRSGSEYELCLEMFEPVIDFIKRHGLTQTGTSFARAVLMTKDERPGVYHSIYQGWVPCGGDCEFAIRPPRQK